MGPAMALQRVRLTASTSYTARHLWVRVRARALVRATVKEMASATGSATVKEMASATVSTSYKRWHLWEAVLERQKAKELESAWPLERPLEGTTKEQEWGLVLARSGPKSQTMAPW